MGLNNLTLFTYTHTNCNDLHKSFFGRLRKFFSILDKHIVLCDSIVDNYDTHVYSNNEPFYKQILDGLSKVDTDYVIYLQEDYILFDHVKIDLISNYLNIMNQHSNVSFIRLIKSGIVDDSNRYNDELFIIDRSGDYYYSTQATIWRKDILVNMFSLSRPLSIRDEVSNSKYLLNFCENGLCSYLVGSKVGGHYNSYSFPYIATAIVQGKWNTIEYKNELELVFNEYHIDKNIRGVNG